MRSLGLMCLALALAGPANAQDFTYRGLGEVQLAIYPQKAPTDDDRAVADARFRFEPAYRATSWLTFAGSFEARIDSLRQTARERRVDWRDRGNTRPAFSVRHAQATLRRGVIAATVGKQFIRWGKTDILTPTDRFAPRDFVEVTDDEFIAVSGVRVSMEHRGQSVDAVVVPVFTPSRIPLPGRRWSATPALPSGIDGIVDLGVRFPDRAQYGFRWNVVAPAVEFSAAFFDGFNHLPQFETGPIAGTALLSLRRTYAPIRMAGMDTAIPTRWFIVKGEAAAFFTSGEWSDDVVLYVVQLERQIGELSLVGGYAGEAVVERRVAFDFAPDRGLTRALLGRASYTVNPNTDVSVEVAVRQTLDGVWMKGQYSRALDAHWRAIVAGAVIGGSDEDFIGQYRRNSHLLATLRYSF